MIIVDKALVPKNIEGLRNLILFKNDELTVWIVLRNKSNSKPMGTEKTIEDLGIELTEQDKSQFGNYYLCDDEFFMASTPLINQLQNNQDDWNYRNEEENYNHQNVVTYLLEKLSKNLSEKQPNCVFILFDLEPEGTENRFIRPYYLYADPLLVEEDLKQHLSKPDSDPWKQRAVYFNAHELPNANKIWQEVEDVKKYVQRIKIFTDYFYKVSKK